MPRDAAGVYTLTSGNPTVTGTVIATATWANLLFPDIATELTDSLSRSGKGPMLDALKNVNGLLATPSMTFNSDLDTGWFRAGANDMRGVAGGVAVIKLLAASFNPLLKTLNIDGLVGAPAYGFASDADTGIYLSSAGDMRVTVAGVDVARFISGAFEVFDGSGFVSTFTILKTIQNDVVITAPASEVLAAGAVFDLDEAGPIGLDGIAFHPTTGDLYFVSTSTDGIHRWFKEGDTFVYDRELVDISAQTTSSRSLAFESDGTLWVLTTTSILKYAAVGSFYKFDSVTLSIAAQTSDAASMAFDSGGTLWIAENTTEMVLEFNPSGATFVYGGGGDDIDAGADTSGTGPRVAVDAIGTMWVVMTSDSKSYRYDPSGDTFTLGGSGVSIVGADNQTFDSQNDYWALNGSLDHIKPYRVARSQCAATDIGVLVARGDVLTLPTTGTVNASFITDDDTILVLELITPTTESGTTTRTNANNDNVAFYSSQQVLRTP